MKRTTLALLAAVGLGATTAAHAEHFDVRGSINFGAPVYAAPAPVYHAPAYPAPVRGYWTDVTREYWVPGRWIVTRNRWGHAVRLWEPPHKECRTERVWVDGYARYDRREHGRRWNG